jgi:hypothetical protein
MQPSWSGPLATIGHAAREELRTLRWLIRFIR